MKKSLYNFLLTLLLLTGCSVDKFQATSGSTLEALAKGEAKEFISAMETQALEAEKSKNWDQAASAYVEATWAAQSSGQLQKAISYANQALDIAQKTRNLELQVRAIYFLALVHRSLRQDAKAREWTEKGIEVTKQIVPGGFKQGYEGNFYRLLGSDYLRSGDLQKAIEYLSYSLQIQEERLSYFESVRRYGRLSPQAIPGAQHVILLSLNTLGTAYRQAGNVEEAVKAYEKGISLIKETGLRTTAESSLYHGLGQVYLRQKDFPRALEYLKKALEMAEGRQQAATIQNASTQIGNLLLQTQRPSEAIPYFQKAIHHIESTRSLLQSEEFRQSFFEGALTNRSIKCCSC